MKIGRGNRGQMERESQNNTFVTVRGRKKEKESVVFVREGRKSLSDCLGDILV